MITKPIWATIERPRFSKLPEDYEGQFDVVVVGAGVTGLTAAYELARAGRRVCLLERDRVAGGESGRTTAHLTAVTDERLYSLIDKFGARSAGLVWKAGEAAIDAIERTVVENQIVCSFQRIPAFLHEPLVGADENSRGTLDKERQAAQKLGLHVEVVADTPVTHRKGIRFSSQAKFHPTAYLYGLAEAFVKAGGKLFEEAEVTEISDKPLLVKCGKREIKTDYLILATHVPLQGITSTASAAIFQTKLAAYSTYAIAASAPLESYPEISAWDTSDPYFYLRVDRGQTCDFLVYGGRDHKTGQVIDTPSRFKELESSLHKIAAEAQVHYRWSGQVIETHDGLPFIGELSENQFIATGYSGNGYTFGVIAGLMAADAAMKKRNPWQDLFSPRRKNFKLDSVWDYVKENADFPVCFAKGYLAAPDCESTEDIAPGEGKIVRFKAGRAACYRDHDGTLTKVSAVCTHLGCVVKWNEGEKTWDCPCHGSRFAVDGKVIAGPAETPLPKVH